MTGQAIALPPGAPPAAAPAPPSPGAGQWGQGPPPPFQPQLAPGSSRTARRGGPVLIVAAALLLVGGGVGVVLAVRGSSSHPASTATGTPTATPSAAATPSPTDLPSHRGTLVEPVALGDQPLLHTTTTDQLLAPFKNTIGNAPGLTGYVFDTYGKVSPTLILIAVQGPQVTPGSTSQFVSEISGAGTVNPSSVITQQDAGTLVTCEDVTVHTVDEGLCYFQHANAFVTVVSPFVTNVQAMMTYVIAAKHATGA